MRRTKFKRGDFVKYGKYQGKVRAVWQEIKRIECDFKDGEKEFSVLFLFDGTMEDELFDESAPKLEKIHIKDNLNSFFS